MEKKDFLKAAKQQREWVIREGSFGLEPYMKTAFEKPMWDVAILTGKAGDVANFCAGATYVGNRTFLRFVAEAVGEFEVGDKARLKFGSHTYEFSVTGELPTAEAEGAQVVCNDLVIHILL